MRRWSLNGDIYVSLLGKATIGGDRHYLRHTLSNSVDFVVRSVIFFPKDVLALCLLMNALENPKELDEI